MKEYKTITPKLGFRNRVQNLEELLNIHAREGWIFKYMNQAQNLIILERDKNR